MKNQYWFPAHFFKALNSYLGLYLPACQSLPYPPTLSISLSYLCFPGVQFPINIIFFCPHGLGMASLIHMAVFFMTTNQLCFTYHSDELSLASLFLFLLPQPTPIYLSAISLCHWFMKYYCKKWSGAMLSNSLVFNKAKTRNLRWTSERGKWLWSFALLVLHFQQNSIQSETATCWNRHSVILTGTVVWHTSCWLAAKGEVDKVWEREGERYSQMLIIFGEVREQKGG